MKDISVNDMKKWHTLSEKIPPINEYVFIMDFGRRIVDKAKLCVHDKKNQKIHYDDDPLKDGAVYWEQTGEVGTWARVETYPFWLNGAELAGLVREKIKKQKEEKISKFDILDIRDDN